MNMPELKISAKQFDFAQATLSFQGVEVTVAWAQIAGQLKDGQPAANDEEHHFAPRPYQPSCAPRPYQPEQEDRRANKADSESISLYQLLEIYGDRAEANQITAAGRDLLDQAFPLAGASHRDAASYLVYYQHLLVILENGESCGLQNPAQFVGFNGSKYEPESIQLRNGELQLEIQICGHAARGSCDPASIEDILIESGIDTVIDCLQPQQQQQTAETTQIAASSNSSEYQGRYPNPYQQGAVTG